jgi:hypothetical protein
MRYPAMAVLVTLTREPRHSLHSRKFRTESVAKKMNMFSFSSDGQVGDLLAVALSGFALHEPRIDLHWSAAAERTYRYQRREFFRI